MRLDKYLSELNIGTRSQVKEFIRRGQVSVNGQPAKSPDQKINENQDQIMFLGRLLRYTGCVYYMMNKPEGVLSATEDARQETVLDLLRPNLRSEDRKKAIFPVGRLDKDTAGLLLLTNDGELAHRLLSPTRHVDKTYLARLREPLTEEKRLALERGVEIGEKHPTLPAAVTVFPEDEHLIQITIHEGKFHQIKRMLRAVDNEVLSLKRIAFGGLCLDEGLQPGQCRELTAAEIAALQDSAGTGNNSCAAYDQDGSGREEPAAPEMDGIEAVIFDLDGTLVDSMWMWRQIDIEYLGKFGIPLPEDLQSCIEGMSFHETAVYFKEHFDIPDSLDQMKADWNQMAWDKYANEVELKPGAAEFLAECRRRNIRLGIATSNSRELMENVAATHGLHDYFSSIMTGGDIKKGKPAPDIYLAVAEQLQVDPARCLVFEDIVPGILAGKNAGMRVCAVEDAYSVDARDEKRALADYYISDYSEIMFE